MFWADSLYLLPALREAYTLSAAQGVDASVTPPDDAQLPTSRSVPPCV